MKLRRARFIAATSVASYSAACPQRGSHYRVGRVATKTTVTKIDYEFISSSHKMPDESRPGGAYQPIKLRESNNSCDIDPRYCRNVQRLGPLLRGRGQTLQLPSWKFRSF